MKQKELLGFGLIAAGLYFYMQNKQAVAPAYSAVPPAPAKNSPDYLAWVKFVVDQFGTVKSLWEPGGPFYKEPIPQYDAGSPFWQDVSNIAGIGKEFDEGNPDLRPNSRVDRYWAKNNRQIVGAMIAAGVDVTADKRLIIPDYVKQRFNLHSIEFGNWMSQADRVKFLYGTAVTLRDMARVLRQPESNMGMHRKLALAFGSRGNGGRAAAFYMPLPYHLINLTKTSGKGTFVHEWGHSVDFYLGTPSGGRSQRTEIISVADKKSTRALFERAIGAVLWNKDGSPSKYQKWIAQQGSRSAYYGQRTEIWARMCEQYFHWKFRTHAIANTWGVDATLRRDIPDLELVRRAAPAMAAIFKRLEA